MNLSSASSKDYFYFIIHFNYSYLNSLHYTYFSTWIILGVLSVRLWLVTFYLSRKSFSLIGWVKIWLTFVSETLFVVPCLLDSLVLKSSGDPTFLPTTHLPDLNFLFILVSVWLHLRTLSNSGQFTEILADSDPRSPTMFKKY